jgi:glutathione S-transferase
LEAAVSATLFILPFLICFYFLVSGPSPADFTLVPRLQWLASGVNDGIATTILEPFPHLRSLIDRLMALPAIVAYYEAKK